ncbi:chemotaxis response regulator protein-glutamate methylesterase [Thalassotalea sp. LPB0316]|uniref:protein-glutamate methylesterase/protein-glutamine glutaminase n=1 Tax=Thalassotalea sp. LPB0316 TaxID=2769490 RepID=UPI001868DBDC|nr:chemotaxis response regulator protein-glutamate methylesterase [Thalassotalea sp. LPB0316]QOL24776.1 chemotaxis response regulator protein-glutamate methylesterase [Thalassotalea sp. LPB0316]
MTKINVLVVDDSRVIRDVIRTMLEGSESINVIGEAENPYEAREKIKQLNPDVLTLDIEMPRMDGITFLKNLMRLRPMPVVMLSSLTKNGADITLEALEIGAVDYLEKPKPADLLVHSERFKHQLEEKLSQAAQANIRRYQSAVQKLNDRDITSIENSQYKANHIIAIGASTGGTEAISHILAKMPTNCPPIVITQHIPEHFSKRFATRLNKYCQIKVKQAQDGAILKSGVAYIAPGGLHLVFEQEGSKITCRLLDSDKINRHRPSVDKMFESLLPFATNVQALLLTGMGADGAHSMLALKKAGATTIIQSKSSSLIWGMPGAAYRLNAHQQICHLEDIPAVVLQNAQVLKANSL